MNKKSWHYKLMKSWYNYNKEEHLLKRDIKYPFYYWWGVITAMAFFWERKNDEELK